ncbi:hypothetical protein ACXHQT_16620 [Vibrio cincinnatiensis]|uniref:hypothetical protein n=1 Tax=Vibrio cincinnatiensis TaxID=675 RepID=UPI001EE05D39|nr:hypothetical protein [Vibrio cincinnatiensis]MCG3737831.1 hypothetical protein [Vibrio cincinnatiensis]
MMILFWGLAVVVAVAAGLYYDVPFLDFLKPRDDIALVQLHASGSADILSQGPETLWYQWQSWLFIALFCLLTALISAIGIGLVRLYADDTIIKKQLELDEKIKELERSKQTFENEKRKELQDQFRREENRLTDIENRSLEYRRHAERLQADAEKTNKKTNLSNKQQSRENRSQLAQRDRLREQKKVLAKYLDQAGWTYTDGEPITYESLLREARKAAD